MLFRSVTVDSLNADAWTFLTTMAGNAEELHLHVRNTNNPVTRSPHLFPRLTRLEIHAGTTSSQPIDSALPAFDAPLLHTLNLYSVLPTTIIPAKYRTPPFVTTYFPRSCQPGMWTGDGLRERLRFTSDPGVPGQEVQLVRRWGPVVAQPSDDPTARARDLRIWSSVATGMLSSALTVVERHLTTEDVAGAGSLMRAQHGLRSFLALERD